MPRKKSEKKEEEVGKQAKPKKQKKEKFIDAEALLDEYLDEMISGLNISFLKLKPEEYKELIKEPFVAAVGQVKSKPKSSTILNRLLANRDAIMEFLAMKLIRIIDIDKLTDDQFEFVVYNTKHAIVSLAPKLYKLALKKNRTDLIDILKYNWNIYGIVSPITCPKCGFNSIMPDFVCKVCDYEISMKELKSQINVIELLKELAEINPTDFKEILSAGYFYYTAEGALAPSKIKQSNGVPQLYFEVVLNKDEKKTLSSIHNSQNQ
ncbi:hypothetical protein DFR86_09635 [Acidianus sulfidivorans JP7]|uniref:Uncharacterized protein n=1 Tax=Acidianus sulfidivorans JP7 TaxID=619593 RepID=A0A2U9IP40_9CREN|nr:hypothetical protein [Acidianus sulfidivorans]AWR97782.1 hypothetical protein DFR86_09635 [Acidianus sulfidivorans JP7]